MYARVDKEKLAACIAAVHTDTVSKAHFRELRAQQETFDTKYAVKYG